MRSRRVIGIGSERSEPKRRPSTVKNALFS
jgi:hypothetical protein